LITVGGESPPMSEELTPNSDVSRTVKAQFDAGQFSELMTTLVMDGSTQSPVRVLLTEDGVSVWTHDNAKTIQALVSNRDIDGLTVDEPCVLLVEPKSFSELLSAKFGGHTVRVQTDAGKPITIRSKDGSQAVYHASDEDDCNIVPDHWVLPVNDKGERLFPMFDNQPATSVVQLTRSELNRGITDMKVAKAPYAVFSFNAKKSECQSGHWGAKTNRSASPIVATLTGEPVEVCFTNNLSTILSVLDGDLITIHKHKDGGFAVLEGATTTVVSTEATREA